MKLLPLVRRHSRRRYGDGQHPRVHDERVVDRVRTLAPPELVFAGCTEGQGVLTVVDPMSHAPTELPRVLEDETAVASVRQRLRPEDAHDPRRTRRVGRMRADV